MVIPLNSTTVVSDSFFPVYDANGVFVGQYFFGLEKILSPQGYYADRRADNMGYTAEGKDLISYQKDSIYFTTPDCSGKAYGDGTPIFSRIPDWAMLSSYYDERPFLANKNFGRVFLNPYNEIVSTVKDAPLIRLFSSVDELSVVEKVSIVEEPICEIIVSGLAVPILQELSLNNPAVTGFQNSYVGPLKIEFTVPPAP